MTTLHKSILIGTLLLSVLACNLASNPAAPTATTEPSATAAPATQAPTTAATETTSPNPAGTPSETPSASANGQVPFQNLANISQYFNPVGQPVQNWNGIPIMPQAIAGQEFQPNAVYSFKATATIAQAVDFYQAQLPALGFTSLMAGASTGSAGSGSNAQHNSVLYYNKGTQMVLFYIASYDSDPSHVSVVIAVQ